MNYRPENILYRSRAPDSDIVIADFGAYVLISLYLSISHCIMCLVHDTVHPTMSYIVKLALTTTLRLKCSRTKGTASSWIYGPLGMLISLHVKNEVRSNCSII